MARKALLPCGILSSKLYPEEYEGYSYASQTSELSAIGAPTRPIVVPLILAYGLLVVVFGFGVRRSASGKRALQIAGNLLIG